MTNRELGNAIRKELKAHGYTNKDVKVSVRDAGYETSARCTIINPLVRETEIKKIVKRFEEIDRDERTLEILGGGNTFIFVQYEYGIFEDAIADLLPVAEKVLDNKEKYSGHAIANNGYKNVHITHYEGIEWTLSEWFDNKEDEQKEEYEYKHIYWIRSAYDLAVAMFRFKNIGTIYA